MDSLTIKTEGEAYTVYCGETAIGRVYRTPAKGASGWQAAKMPPAYDEVGRAGTLKGAAALLTDAES